MLLMCVYFIYYMYILLLLHTCILDWITPFVEVCLYCGASVKTAEATLVPQFPAYYK